MATRQLTSRSGKMVVVDDGAWEEHPPGSVYRVRVQVRLDEVPPPTEDPEGHPVNRPDLVWLASIPALPGVTARCSTRGTALKYIAAALKEALRLYRDGGEPVPWQTDEDPDGPDLYWVTVYLEAETGPGAARE